MKRYEVTGIVPALGAVKHVIKALDKSEAKARFKRAHPTGKITEARALK